MLGNTQWQSKGATAAIIAPVVDGTMGTAITVTGSPQTFTPTFTDGTIANFPVSSLSAITVAGVQTCTGVTAARVAASDPPNPNPNVTFSGGTCLSSSGASEGLRIPVFKTINVTGCSDSTFNGSGLTVNGQDWPNGIINVYQNLSPSTATGCTIVGFDDNSFETVWITGRSGNVLTSSGFAHPHAATDVWGMVGVAWVPNTYGHHDMQGISILGARGMSLWMDEIAVINLDGVGVTPAVGYQSAGSVECDGCWWGQWESDQFTTAFNFQCTSNCQTPSYPYGLRCSQDFSRLDGIGCGPNLSFSDLTILGGIKVDGNGMANSNGSGVQIAPFHNLTVEQPAAAAVMIDPRYNMGGQTLFSADSFTLSDNFIGNDQVYVNGTDCCVSGSAQLGPLASYSIQPLSGSYWPNNPTNTSGYGQAVTTTNWNGSANQPSPASYGLGTGFISDGNNFDGIYRGIGDSLAPSVVPFTTMPVTSAPTCGTCTTVRGPDGLPTSALEVQGTGSSVQVQVGFVTGVATYAGDWVLMWSWVAPGTGNSASLGSNYGPNALYTLEDYGTGTYTFGGGTMAMSKDGWQAGVTLVPITTGDSTPHYLKLSLISPVASGVGNRFWGWGWAFIPGPNNPAYTGVTQAEIVRWSQHLFRGAVPQNFSGVGIAATTVPIAAPVYNVLVPSTGAYAPFASGNLADWTNSSAAVNDVATCTAVTSGACTAWAPEAVTATNFTGSLSGDVTGTQTATSVIKINGGLVPASAPLLGTNSSSQPVSVTTIPTSTMPALTGDATSTAGSLATTVSKINGGTVPASATLIGSNSSGQLTAATTSGSGTVCLSVGCSTLMNGTGNGTQLTSAFSNATTSFASVMALPQIPASTTAKGHCSLIYESSSTSGNVTFGAGLSATPTDLWVMNTLHYGSHGATLYDAYTTITNTTTTAINTAEAVSAANTGYRDDLDFVLETSTNAATLTIFAESNSASYTASVEPGSYCEWLP